MKISNWRSGEQCKNSQRIGASSPSVSSWYNSAHAGSCRIPHSSGGAFFRGGIGSFSFINLYQMVKNYWEIGDLLMVSRKLSILILVNPYRRQICTMEIRWIHLTFNARTAMEDGTKIIIIIIIICIYTPSFSRGTHGGEQQLKNINITAKNN